MSRDTFIYGTDHGLIDSFAHADVAAGDGYSTKIAYKAADAGKNIFGLPTSATVTGSDGKLYRQTSADYDGNGRMTSMKQKLNEKESATAKFEYDDHGNITLKKLPGGTEFKYLYDRKRETFVERITDAFGYRTEMEDYDYRYGIPLTIRDMNGYTIKKKIDALGRTTIVIAPDEQSEGISHTLAFHYYPERKFAKTYHYDRSNSNRGDLIETYTYVDGLGRPLQVQKESVVKGWDCMVASGLVVYDALGREAKVMQPTLVEMNPDNPLGKFSEDVMVVKTYDALDRPLSQTLPADESGEASTTSYKYEIDNNLLKTTIIAPNGNTSATLTDGTGRTRRTERMLADEAVGIDYFYDPIGQVDSLTDAGGNTTRYAYDLAGRKLSTEHPSAGLTTFTYDVAGNLTARQTANLQKAGKRIEYKYDRNRLTEIIYPNHEENNVRYTYGGPNAEHNRVGRIALQEDGSGAQEFFYGTLGEVTKTRRTLIIPNVAVATYTTEWKYDSHGRLLEMTYPDGEKIVYKYDLGGNLCKVFGKKSYLYTYIDTIAYDLFGQRSYIRYGNGAETRYSYSTNRQRLSNLTVKTKETEVMNNTYKYDVMDNIVGLIGQGKPQVLQDGKTIGGAITHAYQYDEWDRLVKATGIFNGGGSKSATYDLRMEYDKLYNITSKQLNLTQNNLQFAGSLKTGYTLNYNYKEDDPFRLESIDSEEFSSESDTLRRVTNYNFDGNGNLTLQLVDTERDSSHVADTMGTKVKNHLWDEENRLLAINDNGFVSNYFYDASGERTVKLSKPDLYVYVNSAEKLKGDSLTMKFVGYVSPYLVVTNGGRYTKHIYAGTQRIASKLGDINAFGADPRRVATAGHDVDNIEPIDYGKKYSEQNDAFKSRFDSLDSKFNGKRLDDYVNGQSFCCGDKNLDEIEKNNT